MWFKLLHYDIWQMRTTWTINDLRLQEANNRSFLEQVVQISNEALF